MARDLGLERAWRKRMRQYERSGMTIPEFCEQEGLVAHQFSWWRSELKRRAAAADAATHKKTQSTKPLKKDSKGAKPTAVRSFVPVEIEPSPQVPAAVEIVLDQPLRIKVTSGFDANLLREVVRVLEIQ